MKVVVASFVAVIVGMIWQQALGWGGIGAGVGVMNAFWLIDRMEDK